MMLLSIEIPGISKYAATHVVKILILLFVVEWGALPMSG